MQREQSSVGKVLLSWAIRPPMLGFLSTRLTLKPASASWRAAVMPATPPPMTRTSLHTSTSTSFRGCRVLVRLMPPMTRLMAFSVAPLSWIQLQCSRMFTWTSWYLFTPSSSTTLRNISSCMWGEQQATTIRSSPRLLMESRIT